MIVTNLLLVALLIAATGFFVAAEFAIVKVRSSRIDQLVGEGNKNAIAAKKVTGSLDEYLSACQLGITITALGLGWLGEPTIEHLLHPFFDSWGLNPSLSGILSFVLAFIAITYLHVVIGELAPKTLAIQKAELVTMTLSRPLIIFYKIMYPFIKTLNGSALFIVRLFGLHAASEHEMAHTEEELRIILSESLKSGEINQSEYKYVNKIFEFDNRIAKEIMVPRTEMVTVALEDSFEENLEIMRSERYTRYPLEHEDKDNIVGLVNIKEVLDALYMSKEGVLLKNYIRPVIKVIETIPIQDLLMRMQKDRIHMAILVDEYGGTAGLVTVEDILEEIVGEIRDEFDVDELPNVQKKSEYHYIFDGKALIEEVNDLLQLEIDSEDVDTIGGWVLTERIDVKKGDKIMSDGYEFTVTDMEGHHIKTLEAKKKMEAGTGNPE
ncbi:hemolysin family protein [Peribacillus frigoritolerans]|uniref:hemolysin family protein n=1 Tax=Peribacillus frigoritolerans TaxID=450367 RepID=UPI00105973F1|nr:hemolysin family protein [Peribacillus frigoritolerans]TDL78581.1 HlyC/CorC family transporter [Peribacillus frigoritolerans]